ncbi:MAG: Transketolase [Cyphobasidiales sp. Tagirdzhanova-0007]|nr:MAG: Transketolase [Cyphobasidiales sp. Tagirdzhanova-0007]
MLGFSQEPNDELCINTIRTLAVDTVNKANSGHPGAPMGMAPIAHLLFSRFLKCNPKNSSWYILLHLLGYKVTLDDLKQFRQIGSITPGHPEFGVTDGIEVTTGPLGQGISNAVGLAIAAAHIAATFNKPGLEIIDNYTFCFLGDGCLQEGIASEACSLAGHLQLGKLIAVWDDNHITIDGETAVSFTEDVEMRFRAYGWHVIHVENGNDDLSAMYNAIEEAKAETNKPTLIRLTTIIGFGSKLQGTHGVHGNPLKPDDAQAIKKLFGFDPEKFFDVPAATTETYGKIAEKGTKANQEWNKLFEQYKEKYPNEAKDLERRQAGKLPDGWESCLPVYKPTDSAVASRKLSETVLSKIADTVPEFICGSADLTGSNLTRWKEAVDFQPPSTKLGTYAGRYVRYGIREHGMGAIMNGISAYGKGLVIPAGGTFLNFVSYGAGAVRLAALSHQRVIWVATHDSIGLGEDGPTHQPIETVAHFRALPNCMVWRPADGNETSAAYLMAMNAHCPSILCLSRQNLPQLESSTIPLAAKGGYVVHNTKEKPDIILVSTGSEVGIAIEAAKILEKEGKRARVVSLPCFEVFDMQPREYRLSVLPDGAPVLSVEAMSTQGWAKYSHEQFGIDTFGASGPFAKVYEKYGLTGPNIAKVGGQVITFYQKRGKDISSPLNTCFTHQL